MNAKQCQKCGSQKIKVKDSREAANWIRRTRKCLDCGYTYTTLEITADEFKALSMAADRSKKAINEMKHVINLLDNTEETP